MSDLHAIHPAERPRIRITSLEDVSTCLGEALGRHGLIIEETQLSDAFFDLRTGIAGELFQKFTTYNLKLAVIVARPSDHGARFSELSYEHRTHPHIRIVTTHLAAKEWITG